VPVQPPEAVQLVAFVLDHVTFVLPPDAIAIGLADRVTVGAAGGGVVPPPVTLTLTDLLTDPPDPLHASVKLVEVLSGPTT
jgi:hypothetical protein